MLRTTALTLGFVLVAAISLPAHQTVPPVVARESAAFIVFTVKSDKLRDSVTRIQVRPMVKIG